MNSSLSGGRVTYPPLDVLKPIAENVWVVDSGPIRILGMPLPVRMTVLRLTDGDLLLHSPTRYEEALRREMEQLGHIRHLVAPNIAHWSFLKEWQESCPDTVTWAPPGLRKRAQAQKASVRLDRDLNDASPEVWTSEIEQVLIPGAAGFQEVEFFHRPTRTLVLTDLVVNLEVEKLPWVLRPGARLAGVAAPNGKAPIYLRLIIAARRHEATHAASRIVGFDPERVIFSHGRWFERDGAAALRRSLSWLLT